MMTIESSASPEQPTNTSPSNGVTGVNPAACILTANAFAAGSGINTQTASQWQIRQSDDASYSDPTFDSGTDTTYTDTINIATSSIANQPTILANNTAYYWHVRYENSNSVWSAYSAETSFTTGSGGYTPPAQPVNSGPTNGEVNISIPPTLQASAFAAGSGGNASIQAASDWQITATSGNYTNPIYDSGVDTTDLTGITISASVILDYSTPYYWHVKYRDGNGLWSPWSTETSFITGVNPVLSATSGGVPVAPVAAGLSCLLVLLKRKKRK